ncbi:hypothetical protein MHN79_01780 [Vibrio sp. Of14-4]|uniref:hypothetical protein n=1 Tax=Vibrio sp. Of14-4 TaxID=2724878 RepID=UPI001EF39D3C|nr:hypothetical protein [Vibrio sp. Of14-4]MCG7488206.1 hypothetical protein [Vibrio sp. Of14-4]
MRLNKYLLPIILLTMYGCSDIVTSEYPTYQSAEEDDLFQRGWLPAIIPRSAIEIVVNNNFDINESSGSFVLSSDAMLDFKERLKPTEKQEQLLYVSGESEWFFDFSDKKVIYYSLRSLN